MTAVTVRDAHRSHDAPRPHPEKGWILLSCVGTRPIYDIGCREVRRVEEGESAEDERVTLSPVSLISSLTVPETQERLHQMHNRCTRCDGGEAKSSQKERRSLKEQQQQVVERVWQGTVTADRTVSRAWQAAGKRWLLDR